MNGGFVRRNTTYGIHYTNWGRPSVQGITFEDNGDYSLYGMALDRLVNVVDCTFNATATDDQKIKMCCHVLSLFQSPPASAVITSCRVFFWSGVNVEPASRYL